MTAQGAFSCCHDDRIRHKVHGGARKVHHMYLLRKDRTKRQQPQTGGKIHQTRRCECGSEKQLIVCLQKENIKRAHVVRSTFTVTQILIFEGINN